MIIANSNHLVFDAGFIVASMLVQSFRACLLYLLQWASRSGCMACVGFIITSMSSARRLDAPEQARLCTSRTVVYIARCLEGSADKSL